TRLSVVERAVWRIDLPQIRVPGWISPSLPLADRPMPIEGRSPVRRGNSPYCVIRSLGSAEVRALPPLRRICKMTNSPDESTTVAVILAKSPLLGLTIPEDTSFQHWLAVGKHLALADNALAWRVGDWWIYGDHRYGDRIAVLRRGGWRGPGFGACRNYATVARAFETSRRRDVLSFSHHREVALLSPEDADRWLDWAEEPLRDRGKPRSTRELRRQVRGQNAPRRRALNGSQTTSADVTDAISEGR